MRLLTVALLCALSTSTALAQDGRDGGPRVRPQDSRIHLALKAGTARSVTFKALVDRIEAGNVIVFIGINPILKPSLAGALTWMTRAGDYRYVRASISADLTFDSMIAAVAHELQHALEVSEDESVTDEKSLIALYRRIGAPSRSANASEWETVAAQRTGSQVRQELVSARSTMVARSGDPSKS